MLLKVMTVVVDHVVHAYPTTLVTLLNCVSAHPLPVESVVITVVEFHAVHVSV